MLTQFPGMGEGCDEQCAVPAAVQYTLQEICMTDMHYPPAWDSGPSAHKCCVCPWADNLLLKTYTSAFTREYQPAHVLG